MGNDKQGFFSEKMIVIVYGIILLFLAYQWYKGLKMRRKLEGERYAFKRPITIINYILVFSMIILGGLNIYGGQLYGGIVIALLGIVFFVSRFDSIIVGENGIYGDTQFVSWKEVKRWGWDKKRGDLILVTKEKGKPEKNTFMRVGVDLMIPVNDRIREMKLGKTK